MSRSALDLLTELIDAAEQTDDYVTGVLELMSGRVGGDVRDGSPRWTRFRLGRRSIVEGWGAAYGPEQLRKAAAEATRLAPLLAELRTNPHVSGVVSRLDELRLPQLPDELMVVAPTDAHDIHARLGRALAALRETRTKLLLRSR